MIERAQRILEAGINSAPTEQGSSRIYDMTLHTKGYAEPGYDGEVVVTGDFNNIDKWDAEGRTHETIDKTPGRVADLLEKIGVEVEWSDEWAACDGCQKLVRTQADSYAWQRSYFEDDMFGDEGYIVCHECVKDDPTSYLEYLDGQDNQCMTIDVDLEEHGYHRIDEDYQNGLYGGQASDPKIIAKALREQGIEHFIFTLDSVGQFDMSFSVWVHEDEELDENKFDNAEKDGVDPAHELREAFSKVSCHSGDHSGEGIQATKIRGSEVETKTITPQEFVEGTWLKD